MTETIAPATTEIGWVYFIGQSHSGPIKVGCSARMPSARLAEIQMCSPVKLEVLGALRVSNFIKFEQLLHERLGQYRLWGEWFDRIAVRDVMKDMDLL